MDKSTRKGRNREEDGDEVLPQRKKKHQGGLIGSVWEARGGKKWAGVEEGTVKKQGTVNMRR